MRPLALVFALSTLACSARSTPAPPTPHAGPLVLSIVATTDLHGHIETLPWLSGHLRVLREARARDGGAVVLVDAGDMFQGTLESNQTEGAAVVRAYNALGYTAAAIGNHEFDYGPEGPLSVPQSAADNARGALETRAREARFPFLAANVRLSGGAAWSPPNIRPAVMVEAAGIKIGLVGVTTMSTPRATDPRNLVGLDVIPIADAVSQEARRLREAGAAIVIVLAHAGAVCTSFDAPDDISSCLGRGQEIFDVARALPAGLVDAIAAGHTHQGVGHRVNGIPIVEAFAEGTAFGRIDLVIDRATRRPTESRILPHRFVCNGTSAGVVTSASPDACQPAPYEGRPVAFDAQLAAVIAPDVARATARREQRLGVDLATPIERRLRGESPAGNLVTDLMRAARPRADVAIYNTGGLRADLPAGPLTYGSLHRLLPFDNVMASMVFTAEDLSRAIVRSLQSGRSVPLSGVKGDVRCLPGGPTLVWRRPDGQAIAPETRLTIATSGFLAADGDGLFAGFSGDREMEPGPALYDVVAEALTARGGIVRGDDPALFDSANPRVSFPGTLPLRCESTDETGGR